MNEIHYIESFEGDDIFHMIEHEMEQFWRDTEIDGSEKVLVRTRHVFKFHAPTLHNALYRGCLLEVDGVLLFIEEIAESHCVAIGDERNL